MKSAVGVGPSPDTTFQACLHRAPTHAPSPDATQTQGMSSRKGPPPLAPPEPPPSEPPRHLILVVRPPCLVAPSSHGVGNETAPSPVSHATKPGIVCTHLALPQNALHSSLTHAHDPPLRPPTPTNRCVRTPSSAATPPKPASSPKPPLRPAGGSKACTSSPTPSMSWQHPTSPSISQGPTASFLPPIPRVSPCIALLPSAAPTRSWTGACCKA